MQIISLNPSDHHRAAQLLSDAFFHYPMFTFYFPDPAHRKRTLSWYLGNVLNCTLQYGKAYTTPDLSGVMMLLLPGHTQISLWEYIQNGFFLTPLRLGLKNYVRSMKCESHVGKTHERLMKGIPHYYLWGLAVAPKQSRQGIGKELMQFLLNKADTEGMPIYLETHAEQNVVYYQRYGFGLMETTNVPGYDLPFWCMVREPNSICEPPKMLATQNE